MLPVEYANTASAEATSTHGMIARPSSPSVRFTALLAPTITRYAHGMNSQPSGSCTSLNIGTMKAVSTGVFAVMKIKVEVSSPASDSQKYFSRADRPFDDLYLILR